MEEAIAEQTCQMELLLAKLLIRANVMITRDATLGPLIILLCWKLSWKLM